MSERFIVTELEGYNEPSVGGGRASPGLSCHVIDTAWNHRLVATYRTERYGRAPYSSAMRYAWIRAGGRGRTTRREETGAVRLFRKKSPPCVYCGKRADELPQVGQFTDADRCPSGYGHLFMPDAPPSLIEHVVSHRV